MNAMSVGSVAGVSIDLDRVGREKRSEARAVDNVMRNLDRRGMLHVARAVARDTGVPMDAVVGRVRHKSVMVARRELYLALRREGLSLPEIGSLLDRDHTTILHGLRPVGARKLGLTPTTVIVREERAP